MTGAKDSAESAIRALPCWNGRVDIAPLPGGLSNENFLVTDGGGKFVARIGRDYPFHHVSRAREAMTARAAHEAGFAPRVHFSNSGVLVTAFIEGVTFGAGDVRAAPHRIGAIVRDFHTCMPPRISGEAYFFWPFHIIRDYARTLHAGRSGWTSELERYGTYAVALERAQAPMPVVFGHNDLLPANFIDDGERLWLIDFEYSGFSTGMFDLAGAASNAGMVAEESQVLLAAYLGHAPDTSFLRAFSAMQCASLLREAMWAMVSEIHLAAPGVDYAAYARENLDKLEVALERHQQAFGELTA